MTEINNINIKKYIPLAIIPIGIFTYMFCVHTVNVGYVGIQSTFGKLNQKPLYSGIYFLNPLSSVTDINTRVFTINSQSEAASSDLQSVTTSISLNYNVAALDAPKMYSQIGSNSKSIGENIIGPAINEVFKSVVANYSAQDLIDKRAQVSGDINKELQEKLSKYNITVDSINVTDFKFSNAFNEAIESKVTAEQKVLTAQNDLNRIKIEAEQKIVRANAEAQALNLQKSAITPELIQLRQVENQSAAIAKWDGRLPTYTGNNLPFIMKQ